MSAGWPIKKLSDVADVRVSNVDKKTLPTEKPVRLCNYMDVYSNRYVTRELHFMEASATASEAERFTLRRGDVVITKDSETPDDIGIPAVISDDIDDLVCGYHLALLRPHESELNPVYLAQQLSTARVARYFAVRASGSTRYGLPISSIESVTIPIPLKPEQDKIAEVLLQVDRALERTERLVAKAQRIKAGLMHDLLTRGIDAHEAIRSENTHAFKATPSGRIPNEWSLGTLLDVTERNRQPILTGPFGADLGDDDFIDEGVPVLRIGNVQQGRLDLSDLLFVSPQKAAELRRYVVKAGDLLFARQGATTGRNALANEDAAGSLINYHIIRVALDQERCAPTFIEAAFASEFVRQQVDREKGRGTREGINTAQLKALQLRLPPVSEQRRIAAVLKVVELKDKNARNTMTKLLRLRTALADDLLSGRKRVTPLLEADQALASVS